MSRYSYERRKTRKVRVGNTSIGGDAPIRVQSMTNTSTLDTNSSAAQIMRIADAGADIVRLTSQGIEHAKNLANIRAIIREKGYDIPLVADIHFNPWAAFTAAETVEKVRINPGNFADPGRTFKKIHFTDEEYVGELNKIREKLVPFLEKCRANGTAIRLGVNHGSLSDRIMSRYGDTPEGMVESVMEYLRICREKDFNDIVISIKASNVVVMTTTVRLLVEAMEKERMDYPLHLGVTEAGDAEDGRVKSAVGIGSLLADGFGDTIRVSLSEEPENEIPVAKNILEHLGRMSKVIFPENPTLLKGKKYGEKYHSQRIGKIGGGNLPIVVGLDIQKEEIPSEVNIVTSSSDNRIGDVRQKIDVLTGNSPIIIHLKYPDDMSREEVVVAASMDFGALILEGYRDGIWLEAKSLTEEERNSLALSILQATRTRITKPDFIACPSCGRTLFDLQTVLARVKDACSHLTGLKIAVMGCIVNGPGEMADADYGYVGASKGCVSLYKGKECLVKNIPEEEALDKLIELIKTNGDWKEK